LPAGITHSRDAIARGLCIGQRGETERGDQKEAQQRFHGQVLEVGESACVKSQRTSSTPLTAGGMT
jgi:hypothetical protein